MLHVYKKMNMLSFGSFACCQVIRQVYSDLSESQKKMIVKVYNSIVTQC